MRKNKKVLNISYINTKYVWGLVTGILITLLVLQLAPAVYQKSQAFSLTFPFIPNATPTPDPKKLEAEIIQKVLPDKLDLGVSFGDTIVKMISNGAIDKQKFIDVYKDRGGLTSDEQSLLEALSDKPIVVTLQNSGLILNLFWPLGIANKTNVLAQGPMGKEYAKEVGNFASTGGWTLGKAEGGKLYNSLALLPLTSEQEKLVTEISQNIYRPCCGNNTYFPDCNHGAAMLGFIELAVVSGMEKAEIYKKALVLNSYWFPQTYTELAMYYKTKKNTDWNKVDAQEVLGANYSSSGGYAAINKQLQVEGILPEVKGGGGCGV